MTKECKLRLLTMQEQLSANKMFMWNISILFQYRINPNSKILIVAPTKKQALNRIKNLRKIYPELKNAKITATSGEEISKKNKPRISFCSCDDICSYNKNIESENLA